MPAMEQKKLLVFVSHASEDHAAATRLAKRLKEDGFDPWLDLDRLLPGQDWNFEIEKALRASDAILLCFSAVSVAKEGYIQREYKRAMKYQEEKPEGTIFVIPVRLDKCDMPPFISEIQRVDYPDEYDRLLRSLQVRAGGSANPKKTTKSRLQGPTRKQSSTNLAPSQALIPSEVTEQKTVQIVIDGKYEEFDETRQQDLISVLAAILKVDSKSIRVLKVYEGSIGIVLKMPGIASYRLRKLTIACDFRLAKVGIISVQLEGENAIPLKKKSSGPSKKKAPSPKETSGNVVNIQGSVHVGGNIIAGDQTNYYYQNQQTINVTSPAQFMDELQKLREEIERLKSRPEVDKAAALRMELAQTEIDSALDEAGKDKSVVERIKSTLDSAKETMEKIGGSVSSAINLGTALGNLALIAMKLFGG